MADSSGTWLKLPAEKWQFIPREIQEQANKLDLNWEGATKLTKSAPIISSVPPCWPV